MTSRPQKHKSGKYIDNMPVHVVQHAMGLIIELEQAQAVNFEGINFSYNERVENIFFFAPTGRNQE